MLSPVQIANFEKCNKLYQPGNKIQYLNLRFPGKLFSIHSGAR